MKGFTLRFLLTALSICLCLTACGADTSDVNSTASSEESQSDISAEQSADVGGETSQAVSEDKAESADLSLQPTESNDISEDIDTSEESAPSEEPSEDEISAAPPTESTEPEPDISKPAEDVSKPEEDISKVDTPAPHTHSYSATTVSPTCTEIGYTLHTCSCGDSYKGDYVNARGHMWKGWIVTKEATAEAEGEETRTCWICKGTETKATERLEPTAIPITPDDAEWICNRILELLNEERAKLGAPALSTAPIAHEMAMVRAQELTVKFAHNRPDGRDSSLIYRDYMYNPEDLPNPDVDLESNPHYRCYMPFSSSENIALTGYYTEGSSNPITTKEDLAVIIVEQFKASAGHWKDLTNPEYTGVGIGIVLEPSEYVPTIGGANTCIMTMDKTYG